MRNLNQLLFIIASLFLVGSCGSADNKKQPEKEITPANRPAEEKLPTEPGSGTTGIIPPKPSKDDILANIDQYLVSTANIPATSADGGIQNATVSIKNTLSDVTIQKAIVEVSILTAEGAEFRTDYYVLQNVEPGETEVIRIPKAARGNSIVSHVVKLKSQELTNGEMVLVGHRISPR